MTVYTFVCRCSLPPVRRWNQTAADAEWNHKRGHDPRPLRKCLPTAAHHENAGVAQCCHLHQRRKQECLLWAKRREVSSLGALFLVVVWGRLFILYFILTTLWMSRVCIQSIFPSVWWRKPSHYIGLLRTDGRGSTLPLPTAELSTMMRMDVFHVDLWGVCN